MILHVALRWDASFSPPACAVFTNKQCSVNGFPLVLSSYETIRIPHPRTYYIPQTHTLTRSYVSVSLNSVSCEGKISLFFWFFKPIQRASKRTFLLSGCSSICCRCFVFKRVANCFRLLPRMNRNTDLITLWCASVFCEKFYSHQKSIPGTSAEKAPIAPFSHSACCTETPGIFLEFQPSPLTGSARRYFY